jgi:hypothetical protein
MKWLIFYIKPLVLKYKLTLKARIFMGEFGLILRRIPLQAAAGIFKKNKFRTTFENNCQFMERLAKRIIALGKKVGINFNFLIIGIYASKY